MSDLTLVDELPESLSLFPPLALMTVIPLLFFGMRNDQPSLVSAHCPDSLGSLLQFGIWNRES